MKAMTYNQFGSVDVLQLADLPTPQPAAGEVLVAVRATSVNPIDNRVRGGLMGPLVKKTFPRVPGADIAGVVAAVGANVTGLAPGDAVFGAVDPFKGGSFSEYVNVPANQLAIKPAKLSFEDAATLPMTGLAALYSLRELGRVKKGDAVLIHGASGAVGLFAIQLAKRFGAHVTAVASGPGLQLVRDFGADVAIDYRTDASRGQSFDRLFDVILDNSGAMPFAKGKRFLKSDGRLIEPQPTIPKVIGSKLANLVRSKKHLTLITVPKRADLEALREMVVAGELAPTIARRYRFEESKDAFSEMERGGVVGKLVVAVP